MDKAIGRFPPTRALEWLARPPPAVRYGLKLGTVMAAAIWISYASGLSWSLTIWITVMFVAQPAAGGSIKKGLLRIFGSVASGLVSIAIYGLFSQQPPLMLASLCAVIAVAIYGMTGPRYQYAWLVFGFTTIIILVKALDGSDLIETLSFERASLTAFGVLIVMVADSFFWPVRAEEQLREGLAARSRQLADTLKQHLNSPSSARAWGKASQPPSPLIQQLGLVDQLEYEIGVTPSRVQGLSRIALLLEGVASRARLLAREAELDPSHRSRRQRTTLAQLSGGLESALVEVSRCLAADRPPESFAEEVERALASFEAERLADLEARMRGDSEERRAGTDRETEHGAVQSALAAVLRDVAALLRSLEEALLGLASERAVEVSEAAPAAARQWFRVDPIRLELALRAGVASAGVIVAMLVMGWSFEEDMLAIIMAVIVAFILAGMSSTRGAGTMVAIGLTGGVLLGWLIADLATVFLFAHLDRMPLSLLYPFAIAGGAGYLMVRGSPLGPLGTLFGMLAALLPVYVGDGPPGNVDVAYGLVCGIMLGVVAALLAARFLWPRSATQMFTERAASQLDLCRQALASAESGADVAASLREDARLVSDFAKQLSQLGQLRAQAHSELGYEPLDDQRRVHLLALMHELFDASLRAPHFDPGPEETAPVRPDEDATRTSLRAALARQDEAIVFSITAAAEVLRGVGAESGAALSEARALVEAQIDSLRRQSPIARSVSVQEADAFLAYLASRRELATRQLGVEAWLADWREAQAT